MGPKFLGSQTGQTWQQILGGEQHRYMRIIVSWGNNLQMSADETPRWESPPGVVVKRAVEVR